MKNKIKLPPLLSFSGLTRESKTCHPSRSAAHQCVRGSFLSALRLKRIYTASNFLGRSMVEMLGVLAIIGVLSAGALAGFNNAMFKHKLNTQTTQYTELFQNLITMREKLGMDYASDAFDYTTIHFIKAGIIPDSFTILNNQIYDSFKTNVSVRYQMQRWNDANGVARQSLEYYLAINLIKSESKVSTHSAQMCQNIIKVAKDFSADIDSIQIRQGNSSSGADYIHVGGAIYGDMGCRGNVTCLGAITIDDIYKRCYECTSEHYCTMYIGIRR